MIMVRDGYVYVKIRGTWIRGRSALPVQVKGKPNRVLHKTKTANGYPVTLYMHGPK
jgi:hypothetical protein